MRLGKCFLLGGWICFFILSIASCGGGGSSSRSVAPPPPTPTVSSVTVSLSSVTLEVGQTQQFTATVQGTGSFNSQVTWHVGDIQGGDSTVGTISSSGLYTAPLVVPSPPFCTAAANGCSVKVKAISAQDSSKFGEATVTITLSEPSVVNHRFLSSDAASILFKVLVGPDGETYASGGPGVMSFDRNLNDRWVFQTDVQFFRSTKLAAKPDFSSVFVAGFRENLNALTLIQISTVIGMQMSEQSCQINNQTTLPNAMVRFGDRLFIRVTSAQEIRVVVTDDLSGAVDCSKNFVVRTNTFGDKSLASLAVTDDSIFVAGMFSCAGGSNNCVWLRAFDHSGNLLWTEEKTFPSHGTPRLVALKEGSETVVHLSMFDFSRGPPEVAGFELHKFNRDGQSLWDDPVFTNGDHPSLGIGSCGSFSGQHPEDLISSPNGDLAMVGSWASVPDCFGFDLALVIVSPAGTIRHIIRTKLAAPGGGDGGEGGSFDPSDASRLVVVGNHLDPPSSPSRGLLVEYRLP